MKPIIFGTDSVRAILDGRMTMTRRVIKPQPTNPRWNNIGWSGWDDGHGYKMRQPYHINNVLWIQEPWNVVYHDNAMTEIAHYIYRAQDPSIAHWRPSAYMPRAAARLFLRVTHVRVERLQDISEEDALAEGISTRDDGCFGDNGWSPTYNDPDSGGEPVFRDGFSMRWDRINGKRDGGAYAWDKNPWVWAITFERIKKPEGV